jgi:hypothetical protein
MTSPATPDPIDRRHPDPHTMTPGEKVMAEWEARHDVAARGSRAMAGSIQHYLSESHSREACERAAQPHPSRPERRERAAAREGGTKVWWWLQPPRD